MMKRRWTWGCALLITTLLWSLAGCSRIPADQDTRPAVSKTQQERLNKDATPTPTITPKERPAYFFSDDRSEYVYHGSFLFNDIVEQDVRLNIDPIAQFNDGMAYALKLEPVEGVPEERLCLGYFYVEGDRIYRFEPTEENLVILQKGKELPQNGMIICQGKEIEDPLGEDEPGYHAYLEAQGNVRVYHSYNSQVNSGYYESYTWEKGKGLTAYRSGFGAERDAIELKLIED